MHGNFVEGKRNEAYVVQLLRVAARRAMFLTGISQKAHGTYIAPRQAMFELSLFDHLRLTFGHIAYRHKAHLQAAQSRVARSRGLRGAEAVLMLGVAFTSVAAAYGRGNWYVVASAVLGSLALLVLLFHIVFDLEGSARAHQTAAARLWQIREQYRAVLSDLHDGAIDPEQARRRRDALTDAMHDFLERAPSVPPQPHQPGEQG